MYITHSTVALYASLFAQIDCTVLDNLGWGFKTGCKLAQRVSMNDTELGVYVPNGTFQLFFFYFSNIQQDVIYDLMHLRDNLEHVGFNKASLLCVGF